MNVLLTSAGRRTSLLKEFKAAIHRRNGQLFVGDVDGLAPAVYLADKAFRTPHVKLPEYIPYLLNLVKLHNIGLIVPTIDTELPVLSSFASEFRAIGCEALISKESLVHICGDKWELLQVFHQEGVHVPRSWLPEEVTDFAALEDVATHLFVKPRAGSAGQDTYYAKPDELPVLLPRVPNPIIQEEIKAREITIDALFDLNGQPIHYVPRLRIRTVGGESIQGVTLPDDDISDWIAHVLRILSNLGARGPITIQAFLTEGEPTLSEVNPRFGGGFPLALAAGGDYPEWILQMLEGRKMPQRMGEYQRNLYMTRYYQEIFREKHCDFYGEAVC